MVSLQSGVVNLVDVSLTDSPAPTVDLKGHRRILELKENGKSCYDP